MLDKASSTFFTAIRSVCQDKIKRQQTYDTPCCSSMRGPVSRGGSRETGFTPFGNDIMIPSNDDACQTHVSGARGGDHLSPGTPCLNLSLAHGCTPWIRPYSSCVQEEVQRRCVWSPGQPSQSWIHPVQVKLTGRCLTPWICPCSCEALPSGSSPSM